MPTVNWGICWQIWCQRTVWKQITTLARIGFNASKLANMVSKNGLKANHNWHKVRVLFLYVGKYGVKERFESKSQQNIFRKTNGSRWQIWCQRTVWKQITTGEPQPRLQHKLANMVSKNGLKANHNLAQFNQLNIHVGKYGVKERFESKSQQSPALVSLPDFQSGFQSGFGYRLPVIL